MSEELAQLGRAIVDEALYMVLATADADGRPWASPVYFAHLGYRELVWVSKPGARHSRNLEQRPELSIAVFDSSVPIGTGRGVYLAATAGEVDEAERARALEVFNERSLAPGGDELATDDVVRPARLRLYRAIASDQYVLDESDFRVPVEL